MDVFLFCQCPPKKSVSSGNLLFVTSQRAQKPLSLLPTHHSLFFARLQEKTAAVVTENAAINKVQQVNRALLSQRNFLIATVVTQQKPSEINTTVGRFKKQRRGLPSRTSSNRACLSRVAARREKKTVGAKKDMQQFSDSLKKKKIPGNNK